MDIYWWCCRLWRCADAASWYAVAAMAIRWWLVPWACWLTRRAMCWCHRQAIGPRAVPTCRCCGGIDFDGAVGRWAVVTGCTDGIGKEFAFQLADLGLNVVLVGRNLVKLQAVASEIYERHASRIQTSTVVADFTSSGGSLWAAYDAVRRGLTGLDLAVLINNAGVSYPRPGRLLEQPPCCCSDSAAGDTCRDVVECNALAVVAMCRIVMPMMMNGVRADGVDCTEDRDGASSNHTPSQRPPIGGVIINVSSVSAKVPCPLLSVYGATKAFLEKFSEELANEYGEESGGEDDDDDGRERARVAFRCLTPGFVATKMSRIRPGTTSWTMVPAPGAYARRSLRSLSCYCACRARRRDAAGRRENARDGRGGTTGRLEDAVSAVFDSPSSPFSPGRAGTTTTGYLPHTIMMMAIIAIRWTVGDVYVSNVASRQLSLGRDRMARKDAAKGFEKREPVQRFQPNR